jgi:hypothetical protein
MLRARDFIRLWSACLAIAGLCIANTIQGDEACKNVLDELKEEAPELQWKSSICQEQSKNAIEYWMHNRSGTPNLYVEWLPVYCGYVAESQQFEKVGRVDPLIGVPQVQNGSVEFNGQPPKPTHSYGVGATPSPTPTPTPTPSKISSSFSLRIKRKGDFTDLKLETSSEASEEKIMYSVHLEPKTFWRALQLDWSAAASKEFDAVLRSKYDVNFIRLGDSGSAEFGIPIPPKTRAVLRSGLIRVLDRETNGFLGAVSAPAYYIQPTE